MPAFDMEKFLDAIREVESGGNPRAVSPVGAKGPYQFMDATAKEYGLDDPFNEEQARKAARNKVSDLMKRYGGNMDNMLAAWNWGDGNLAKKGFNKAPKETTDFIMRVREKYSAAFKGSTPDVSPVSTPRTAPAVMSLFPEEDTPKAPPISLFPEDDGQLRSSVLGGNGIAPDKAARVYRLGLKTGLPEKLIERNLDELESLSAKQDFDAEDFRQNSPLVAKWLEDSPIKASLAQADYESLSLLEKTWEGFRVIPSEMQGGAREDELMTLSFKEVIGTATPQERARRQRIKSELETHARELQGWPSWTGAASKVVGQNLSLLSEAMGKGVKYGAPAGAATGAALGLIGGPGAPATVALGAAVGGLTGMKAVAAASLVTGIYERSVGEAYDDFVDLKHEDGTPLDPTVAKFAALLVGAPNAALETFSLSKAAKIIPGAEKVLGKLTSKGVQEILVRPSVRGRLAEFGKRYAAAVATETVTEGLQEFLQIVTGNTITDGAPLGMTTDDWARIAGASEQAFKATVVLGTAGAAPKMMELRIDMEKAKRNQMLMQQLGDVAKNSTLAKNSPEALNDIATRLGENSDVKNVFIPLEAWDLAFQDGAQKAAVETFGNLEQYAQAKLHGGDIVVPIGTYAEKIAPTQFHEQFLPDLRLSAGDISLTEMQQAEQIMPELEAQIQEEAALIEQKEIPVNQVYEDVRGKLIESGMNEIAADRNAALWKELYRVRAERLGMNPYDLYNEAPLTGVVRSVDEAKRMFAAMPKRVQPETAPAEGMQVEEIEEITATELPGEVLSQPGMTEPVQKRLALPAGEINLPEPTLPEAAAIVQAAVGTEEFGGATVHPELGNRAGEAGVAAVAGYPQRGVVTEGTPTPDDISTFMRMNRDIFGADPNANLGVWVDEATGKGYLDISQVLPIEDAIKQGERFGEIAIWDLGNMEEIRLPVVKEGEREMQATLFQGSVTSGVERGEQTEGAKTEAEKGDERGLEGIRRGGETDAGISGALGPDETAGIRQGLTLEALHFSREKRESLTGVKYGTGLRGAEARRLENSDDARIKQRIHFYVDEGGGVKPESGVGAHAHKLTLDGLYDTVNDPDKIRAANRQDFNAFESAVLDAGYRGHYVKGAQGKQGVAVLLGDQTVTPEYLGLASDLLKQEERGFFSRQANIIGLLKTADPSTFLHESGHFWFEQFRADALRENAPAQLRADWETLKEWSGATDEAIPTDAHEMFARGIEAYVREGKSPSMTLQSVFAQFAEWLTKIYKSMKMLDVELTDEVKEVMDRMFATEDAINAAREYNNYHKPMLDNSLLTDEENEAYRQLNEQAKNEAQEAMRVTVMKELRRESMAEWRKVRDSTTREVENELNSQPVWKALSWLQRGKLPDGKDIPGVEHTRLSKDHLVALGVDLKSLPPASYQVEGGLHPDVIAEMFGFPDGKAFLDAVRERPSKRATIENEVKQRMQSIYGDTLLDGSLVDKAAVEVQNSRQVELFNFEMRVMKRLGARKNLANPAILKELARTVVSRQTVRSLDPRVYEQAALKAGNEAQAALLGRDFRSGLGRNVDAAFDAKQRQLLNIYLYREAVEKKQDIDKTVGKWERDLFKRDDRLAKTRDMNMVNAARAIVASRGIGSAPESAMDYMNALRQYDPTTYEDLKDLVEMTTSDHKRYDQLTVSEFGMMKDAVQGLLTLSRRSKQIEIEGKLHDRATKVRELNAQTGRFVPASAPRLGYNKAVSKWEKTKQGLMGLRAIGRRAESWADAMDYGNADKPFQRTIVRPVINKAEEFRHAKVEYLTKFQDLLKPIAPTITSDRIVAPFINFEFTNKAHLLGAMLHRGNESNFQKLLRGREWGGFTPDGELDSSKWDQFEEWAQKEGILTKADYDFLQSVWDLLDEIKPLAQKAHKEIYGYYFSEITATPFATPYGTYRGGYVPAMVDINIVEDAAIRADRQALEGEPAGFMFPSVASGFTKKRQEAYARPLSLDLGLIPSHISAALKFAYLGPITRDVGRVILDKSFRATLQQLDSQVGQVMLAPWLARAASQTIVSSMRMGVTGQQINKFFSELRKRAGANIMFFNVTNTLQQFTGIAVAATKVKPRYLAGGVTRLVRNPFAYAHSINEKSKFMAGRTTSQMFEVQRSIDSIILNPSKFQKAKAFADQHTYFMQVGTQNVVDLITWGGAYEQFVKAGLSEAQAIQEADSAVRLTQGDFSPESVSRFETGPAYIRVFTMFSSYFNMMANLLGTEFGKAQRQGGFKGTARALYVYTLGFMIPAVVSEAIVQAMSGDLTDDDDDDGYLDNLLEVFFMGQVKMATGMVPLVGPAAMAGINKFNDKWYDDQISMSPAVRMIESVTGTPAALYEVSQGEDARLKGPIRDVLTLVGVATGLPLAAAARPLGYLADVEQGYVEPEGPIDFTRGLVSGRAPQ